MQPPRRRSHRGLWIALGVIVLVLVVCGVAVSRLATLSSNTGTVVTTGNTPVSGSTPTTAPSSQHFKVGDQVKVGDTWLVTIESAKTSEGSQFNKPQKTGNVFLVFSVSMKNVSNQEQEVSSALQWTLQDTTGQKYTETIDTDAGATLDGKVEAGAPLKGSLAYEVPKATKAFTLAFEASLTEPGQTIWDITV